MKDKYLMFLFIMLSFDIVFWISVFISNGRTLENILFCQNSQTFMDYFECICIGKNPYEGNGSYPPMAYVFFSFFSKMIPDDILEQGMFICRNTQLGMYSMLLFFITAIIFNGYIIKKYFYEDCLKKKLLLFCITSSLPVIFLSERMNIVIYIMPLMYIFIMNYRSDNLYKRNVAYISLAIASSLKMYPALLGFLVIKRKNIKEAFVLIGYGILFFVKPFILFGGSDGVRGFFDNFFNSLTALGTNLGFGYKVNIDNTISWVGYMLGIQESSNIISTVFKIIIVVLTIICISFATEDDEWKCITLLVLLMLLIPQFSFVYSLILLFPSLFLFLDKEKSNLDNIYIFLFAIIFSPIVVLKQSFFPDLEGDYYLLNISTMLESVCLVILFFILICDIIHKFVKQIYFTYSK